MGLGDWLRRRSRRLPSDPAAEILAGDFLWRGSIEGSAAARSLGGTRAFRDASGEIPLAPEGLGADAGFGMLTPAQAARLRRLVRQAFAERGHECLVSSTWATDSDGTTFGLWNVAAACRGLPDEAWPATVNLHVAAVLAARPTSALSTADVLAALRLRLVHVDSLPALDDLPHCFAVAPGLVEILSLEMAEVVLTPTRADLLRHGTIVEMISRARSNLRGIIGPQLSAASIRTPDGLSFTAVSGEGFHIGSLALVVSDLVEALDPGTDTRRGVFVAVPDRHQVVCRPVVGLSSLMSVQPLAAFAHARHARGIDPVSPHVFWVRNGAWTQLTFAKGQRVAIHVSTELTKAIDDEP